MQELADRALHKAAVFAVHLGVDGGAAKKARVTSSPGHIRRAISSGPEYRPGSKPCRARASAARARCGTRSYSSHIARNGTPARRGSVDDLLIIGRRSKSEFLTVRFPDFELATARGPAMTTRRGKFSRGKSACDTVLHSDFRPAPSS